MAARSRLPIVAIAALACVAWPSLAQDAAEDGPAARFLEIPNRGPGVYLDTVGNKIYMIKEGFTLLIIDPVTGKARSKALKRAQGIRFKAPPAFVPVQPFNRRVRSVDLLDQRNGIVCSLDIKTNTLVRADLLGACYEKRELPIEVDPKDKKALSSAEQKRNEAAAVRALRTLSTAQAIFRESDRDRDGLFDYATLVELGQTGLIDSVLATGSKQGYVFKSAPSTKNFEYTWWATAHPKDAASGRRCFFVNYSGVIQVSDKAIEVDLETCKPTRALEPLDKPEPRSVR